MAPGVEVGSEIRIYRDTSPLGRIAAQLAKQIIFQKVREAKRDTVFQEYAHREKSNMTCLFLTTRSCSATPSCSLN